jgi:hypothetical protein
MMCSWQIQFCQTCGWNLDEAVDMIQGTVEEYRDLAESIPKRRQAVREDIEDDCVTNDPFPSFPPVL